MTLRTRLATLAAQFNVLSSSAPISSFPRQFMIIPTRIGAATLAALLTLTGCSTSSKNIAADYVSPIQYSSYDCDQVGAETQRVKSRAVKLGARLDEAASNDAAITGVGLILFWPALFALGGTKQQEAEYGRLSGELEALQQVAIEKKCGSLAKPQQSASAS